MQFIQSSIFCIHAKLEESTLMWVLFGLLFAGGGLHAKVGDLLWQRKVEIGQSSTLSFTGNGGSIAYSRPDRVSLITLQDGSQEAAILSSDYIHDSTVTVLSALLAPNGRELALLYSPKIKNFEFEYVLSFYSLESKEVRGELLLHREELDYFERIDKVRTSMVNHPTRDMLIIAASQYHSQPRLSQRTGRLYLVSWTDGNLIGKSAPTGAHILTPAVDSRLDEIAVFVQHYSESQSSGEVFTEQSTRVEFYSLSAERKNSIVPGAQQPETILPLSERNAVLYSERQELTAQYFGEPRQVPAFYQIAASSVALLPLDGGKHFANIMTNGSYCIRAADSGKLLFEAQLPLDAIIAVKAAPDNESMAILTHDGQLALVEWIGHRKPPSFANVQDHLRTAIAGGGCSISVTSDGQSLAIASNDGLELYTGSPLTRRFFVPASIEESRCVTLSPDGRRLASSTRSGIRIWNSHDFDFLVMQDLPSTSLRALRFFDAGRRLAAIYSNLHGGLAIWDAFSAQLQRVVPVEGVIGDIAVSESDAALYLLREASADLAPAILRLAYDASQPTLVDLDLRGQYSRRLAVDAGAGLVLTLEGETPNHHSGVSVWNLATGKRERIVAPEVKRVSDFVYDQQRRRVLVLLRGDTGWKPRNSIAIYDLQSGALEHRLDEFPRINPPMALAAQEGTIITSGHSGEYVVWSLPE